LTFIPSSFFSHPTLMLMVTFPSFFFCSFIWHYMYGRKAGSLALADFLSSLLTTGLFVAGNFLLNHSLPFRELFCEAVDATPPTSCLDPVPP